MKTVKSLLQKLAMPSMYEGGDLQCLAQNPIWQAGEGYPPRTKLTVSNNNAFYSTISLKKVNPQKLVIYCVGDSCPLTFIDISS